MNINFTKEERIFMYKMLDQYNPPGPKHKQMVVNLMLRFEEAHNANIERDEDKPKSKRKRAAKKT